MVRGEIEQIDRPCASAQELMLPPIRRQDTRGVCMGEDAHLLAFEVRQILVVKVVSTAQHGDDSNAFAPDLPKNQMPAFQEIRPTLRQTNPEIEFTLDQ